MEVAGSVPALEPTPPGDLDCINDAVAHVNVAVAHSHVHSHVPLHRECSAKIKHLKSTFGCPSGSVLNQDDDGYIAPPAGY